MAKPLQVYVDEAELDRLDRWSKARGWSKSQAIRVALRVLTADDADDPLLTASGMIHGLPRDMSGQIDRALQETFVASPKTQPETQPKARRTKRRVR